MGFKVVLLAIVAGVCLLLMFFHNHAQRLVDSYKPATRHTVIRIALRVGG